MSTQILATKLYKPAPQPGIITRPRLIDRLNAGLNGKITLISAPAGFGKTTLVTDWIASKDQDVAWLSLDEGDNDPIRFLSYFVAALQTVTPQFGTAIMNLLRSPQPPPIESLLTSLLNEIMTIEHQLVLVLDDYHALENQNIDSAFTFLIDNQPPQLHIAMTTREDPRLPIARLRAKRQLNELRAADLRFTAEEAAEFLNHAMGLDLSPAAIAALEARTEGWIAGLQLAAISMQGQDDATAFIESFTGSHHFVLDYLVEEVLDRQPQHIQDFLLQTSILDRMCSSLCGDLLQINAQTAENTLEGIRQANLFLIPLDNERQWYRYHHLFGDLLRKRLSHSTNTHINDLHIRASIWYEANGLELEAFQHAAAGRDVERAARLIAGTGVPLYFRGIARPVLNWLDSLPSSVLDATPSLWITYAWTFMAAHRSTQIEPKLQAAEAALANAPMNDKNRDLLGQIAAIRAMEAAIYYQPDTIIQEAHDALALLSPDNLYMRTVVTRALAIAYQFNGERAAARETYVKAIAMSEASDNFFINILSTTGLAIVQESDLQLHEACENYHRVLELVGNPNQPISCAAYLGLARIYYEWNDLNRAQEYGEHGVYLAQQIESIDSAAGGKIFLALLKLAHGDFTSVSTLLDKIAQEVQQRNFTQQIPVIAASRVLICLRQGDLQQAVHIAYAHDLPLSQARVELAQQKPADAMALLIPYRQEMETKYWYDECLKAMILEALAHFQSGDIEAAINVISSALELTIPGGLIRTFLDEGQSMMELVTATTAQGIQPDVTRKLLSAFHTESLPHAVSAQPLIEPLSDRELEILGMVADGLSNREISDQLFLALSTVKGHNRNIFDKLMVKRRTEAVARARELGLI